MFLKKLVVFGLLVMLSAFVRAEESPYQIVQDVASKTFARIKAEQTEIKKDPELLRVIVEEELLPYVDYKFAGAKVLGKHFASISKKQRDKVPVYFEEFRKYLIVTYAGALAQYEDQEVEFEPIKDHKGKKAVTVRAIIKDPERPDIKIAFKIRKSRKTKEWKAYDMIAEGISLLNSKRSEFEAVLRQDGIDKVIAIMKEKNSQKVKLEPQES